MAVNQRRNRRAVSAAGNGPSVVLVPQIVRAQRAPTNQDFAEIGTTWIDIPNNGVYVLTSIVANNANWSTSPASGGTIISSLQVTGAGGIDVDTGDIDVTLGDINVPAGDVAIGGDLTVNGTLTFTGDLDLTSAALIDLTSTLNAAPSVLIRANGGVSEQILIHSLQGTSVNSIELDSDAGGITLVSGLASDDAINLFANAGGIDLDAALQINISSTQNAADAIVINAAAGGIDITNTGAAGEDIDIVSTGASVNITSSEAAADAIVLNASDGAGGVQVQAGTGGILIGNQVDCTTIDMGDIAPTASRTITVGGGLVATAGVADTIDIGPDGVNNATANKTVDINGGELTTGSLITYIARGNRAAGTHTVNISTGTGTKTVNLGNADGLTTFNIDAVATINDSLNANTSINTGSSTGTVSIGNGAAGAITVDSGAGISLDAAAASNFSTSGSGIDLTLASAAGRVIIDGGEAGADSITLDASNVAGGIDIDSGTGGMTIDSTGAISIAAAAASDFSVSGAGIDLTLASAAGRVIVNGEEAAANAVTLLSAAGGILADAALQINIDSSQAAAADSIRIVASAADGGMDLDSGTGGTTIDSTGGISIDGIASSTFNVSGAGNDLTLSSASGRVVVNGEEAANDAIALQSIAGGIDADCTHFELTATENALDSIAIESTNGGVIILASNASAGQDIVLNTSGSSVNLISDEAVSDAISLQASDASGGIELDTGGGPIAMTSSGNVSLEPETATVAGTSTTINARVGVATFTGQTTASGAQETFTITNAALTAGVGVFVTVSNRGSNDARMTLERVNTESAGSLVIDTQNNGAAALNGDVVISFWIIN